MGVVVGPHTHFPPLLHPKAMPRVWHLGAGPPSPPPLSPQMPPDSSVLRSGMAPTWPCPVTSFPAGE